MGIASEKKVRRKKFAFSFDTKRMHKFDSLSMHTIQIITSLANYTNRDLLHFIAMNGQAQLEKLE